MKKDRFFTQGLMVPCTLLLVTVGDFTHAEDILYEEGFNDDGDGTRYTVEGGLVSEVPQHEANGINTAEQIGPVYWGHSIDVSLVGVPAASPAKRAVIGWASELEADQVTDEGMALVESTLDWLLAGKANPRVLFSPPPGGPGDAILVGLLEAKGGIITDDDPAGTVPSAANFDLVIHSNLGASPSRFTTYAVPYLTYNAPDHDDELVGTIGFNGTFNLGDITVQTPEHPAAGGQTGAFRFFNGEVPLHLPGTGTAEGAAIVATYPIVDIPPIASLAIVEQMVSGEIETSIDEGTAVIADLAGSEGGHYGQGTINGDVEPPGNPLGSFATVSTGEFEVKTAGTYGFALWVAGGGRLVINGETVIEQNQAEVVDGIVTGQVLYADASFDATGTYGFEWTAFSPLPAFGSEVFFTQQAGAGQREALDDQSVWAPLADWESAGLDILPINLAGEIAITTYEQPARVLEERPLIVTIDGPEEGGQVFGGGAFLNSEGAGFFAGAALNKYGTEEEKRLTLNPVDVSGETGLKLKILLAATTLDFETDDYLEIQIDPNNSGTFTTLTRFSAPSADKKFFSNGTYDLDPVFKEAVFDLPDGATQLVVRIAARTTWWNEIVAFDRVQIVKGDPEPQFTELWLLGDATNGNQTEFSQELGDDGGPPGSPTEQDDDFYFWGVYPDPIGTVREHEPFAHFDRAHVTSDTFNRIHFNLDADSAAADTQLRMTFALCCFGAADNGPSEHDLVFRLNGTEFFSDTAINSDRIIEQTVTAGDYNVVEGANVIEIERTDGSTSSWVQYDYIRLEATAGAPVPQPDDGGQPGGDFDVATGLLGYWRLDETSGAIAADSSGNGHDGMVVAPEGVWVDDATRGAVYHSSDTSYIEFGTVLPAMELDTDFTWSFWVNAEETDNNDLVFGNRYNPDGVDFEPREFIKFTPRVFEWHFNGAGENLPGDGTMLVIGEWTHNLAVKSGTTLTYYRNGETVATGEITGAPVNPQPLYIGGQNGLETFSGLFDEVAVYARALTGVDVAEVYRRGMAGEALVETPPPAGPLPGLTGISVNEDGTVVIAIPAAETYDIQWSSNLVDWLTIASDVVGSYEDTDPARLAEPAGFYRGTK